MLFREKIAWLSLAGILIAFVPYFIAVARFAGPLDVLPFYSLGLFAVVVLAITALMIVGSIAVAVTSLSDANAPADERDRIVARRASSVAYAVLVPGIFIALATVFLGMGQAVVLNAVLAAVVLAEILRCGLEIRGYRRGW